MKKTIAALLFIWAGLLFGVSFVATPVKFLAPSLTLAQALDVGRWTFHVLAWIEWAFVFVAILLLFKAQQSDRPGIGIVAAVVALVAIVLAAENFILRPLLDNRVLRIIAGESVQPSHWHNVYIALEALRLILLFAGGVFAMRLAGDRNS